MAARVTKVLFGSAVNGMQASLITIRNNAGVSVAVTNYGATLQSLVLPSREGEFTDCVLGFDSLSGYTGPDNPYFGCTVGRVANRIANGQFLIGNQTYTTPVNNGAHTLHGGSRGFDKVLWDASVVDLPGQPAAVKLMYNSPDGEEGFPGECAASVTYQLTEESELHITMEASVSAPCPVSLANHSYFNLGGHNSGDVLAHQLHIPSEMYTPTDSGSIPTGQAEPVAGTPFDFRASGLLAHTIGERIGELKSLPGSGGGYDHNYVLAGKPNCLSLAASVVEPVSGRKMEVLSDAPGMQLYSANYLGPSVEGAGLDASAVEGKKGAQYGLNNAFCLETQHPPDAINQPKFPSPLLQPGDLYSHRMVLRFSTE